jgi:NAD(P)-dependent dehydrogenase (short-subunit alcohol dehydrogenase family)
MKTALITGANRGIGLALAGALKRQGYRVIAVCRQSSPALDSLAVTIESGIDVTSADSLRALADRLAGDRIDLLVNNAGFLKHSSFAGVEEELADWRAQYEINALSPVRVSSALSSHLNDGGKLVIITSRMGSVADNSSGGHYAYRMAKAAVNAAGVCLAHELKPRGIAVGLLHPGYVRTDMTGHSGHVEADEAAAMLIERIQELDLSSTGSFRHANGESLPW